MRFLSITNSAKIFIFAFAVIKMKFQVFDSVPSLYKSMLSDIRKAKKSIYLETYIYDKDKIGQKFKELLTKKAREGLDVKTIVDAWGSEANESYFKELIRAGGKIKEFSKFRLKFPLFHHNHKRDHRKLLIIDNKIIYVGSANITADCLNWREVVLKLEGKITKYFSKLFFQMWETKKLLKRKPKSVFEFENFKIIGDRPSHRFRPTEKEYLNLISLAKKEILIETPYFVPTLKVRRALREAAIRGVHVFFITPHISDVKILDIIKEKYFGSLYRSGVRIFYYPPKVLHSKLMVVDEKYFIIGSSNVDYRSFVFQYESNLSGTDETISKELSNSFKNALKHCREFNYLKWKKRPFKQKLAEKFLDIFKRVL